MTVNGKKNKKKNYLYSEHTVVLNRFFKFWLIKKNNMEKNGTKVEWEKCICVLLKNLSIISHINLYNNT